MPEQERRLHAGLPDSVAPTILLIHGFPLNSSLWESQIEDLSDTARVLAPDLRGFGLSEATPAPYSMEMMADDCMGLLDSLGIQEPVVVCGLSMGGYIAFEFYRRFPDWVAGLILVATRARADDEVGRAGRDNMIAGVRESGVEPVQGDAAQAAGPTYERNELLVNFVRGWSRAVPRRSCRRAGSDEDAPRFHTPAGGYQRGVLIIHGEEDQIIPVSQAEAMRDEILTRSWSSCRAPVTCPPSSRPTPLTSRLGFLQSLEEGE